MSRLGPTGLTQLLTNIKTWITTKLGNYVTTDTTQTITGKKSFTNAAIQLDSLVSMSGSTMFINTSASVPRGAWPTDTHRVGRIYIGDNTSYNGAWFIVDPIIDTTKAVYRMVTTNPDNTDSTRFSIVWDGSLTGARCRKNVSQGDLVPYGDNTYNLGSDSNKWDIGYIHNLIGSNKEDKTEDANNYYSTTSGSHMTFYTTSNGGTKLSNVPAAVNTHLESRTIRYLSSSDWIIEQICHNSFGLYYRKGTNGTWEDWKTFAFTNSNITGTAANVTGIVAIANGGTGATTRLNAVKALTNESVGSPTHFLAITTNWGKAGYTTVAQAKTVLGITGDMGSHSDSEYVHMSGDETIGGNKTFSNNVTINGTYLGTEASTNERTNIYLLANRDTADTSGAYIGRFRQNRTQGAMQSGDVSFVSFDFLENSTRYTRCFTMGLTDWDGDGVPQTYYLTSPGDKGSLGTATTRWNKVYGTEYYYGVDNTEFSTKFVTTDTAQTITGVKTFNSDTLVSNQGNTYRIANSAGTGYGIFQRMDGTYWYMLVTANDDPLGTWTSARPITIRLSDGYCTINGKANEANKVQATIAAGATTALVQATVASNDCFRIAAGGAANAGWAEIATGDDANEPIYVRQYKGSFTTLQRTATLLDGSGNTSFPGTVTATGFSGPVSDIPSGTTYVSAVADGGAVVNSQAAGFGAIWRAPTKNYQVAAASWPSNGDNVYICYSVANTDVTEGNNTVSKSLIWNAGSGTLTTTTFSGALSGNASSATEFSANTTVALTGDATGTSAGSKKGWSVPVTLANSGVTAGDYGPSEDASPAHSGTFTVPSITVDAKGRITAASTKTITLPADNNTDTKATQTVTNGNACYPLLIANTASASHTGEEPTTETDGVRKAYNINIQARYGFIYARNSYNSDNLKGSVAGGNRTSAGFYGSTYDGATVGGVELGRVDEYGNRYSRLYATNHITDGALAPDGTAVATTFDVGVLADGTKYLNTSAGWYCNVYPTSDNTRTLGTASLKWSNVYATTFTGDLVGNATTATEFSANKDVTLTGDVTGTASSKAGWSVATTLANSGVTAGTYGPSADVTGSNNATILVPEITVDAKGRVTAVNNRTYTSVNTDSDKKVYQYYKSDDNVYRLLFSNNSGNTATSNVGAVYSGLNNSFYVNPSTGSLYATKLYSNGVEVLTAHPSITLSTNTTSTESPSHGGTFTCIDSVTRDSNGHITKVNTKTITLPADSNTDTKVTQTVTTANSGYPVLLSATANATTTGTTTSRFSEGLTVNARYSAIYMTNRYDTANTKGVRDSTKGYLNGDIIFRCYDASEMGRIHCESSKNGYQQTYMQARSYIKNGAISPEGTATTCYITVRVRDNGSKTIYTDGSWENSLTPYANNTHSLGTSSLQWKNAYAVNIYENGTALSSKYAQIDNISANGIGTTCLLAYFPAGTGDLSLVTGQTKPGTSLCVVYWRLESTASVSGDVYTDFQASLVVNKAYVETGTWKLLHSMSQGATSKAMIGVWVRIL